MAQQPPTLARQSNQPRSHSGPTTAAGQRAMQRAAQAHNKGPNKGTGKGSYSGGSKGGSSSPAPAGGNASWKAWLSNPTNAATFTQAFNKAYAPASPFLTPAQQAALNNWNTKYGGDVANLAQSDVNAWTKYNQGVSDDTFRNAQQADITNQSMAARGLFTSSIRSGALNDLAVSLQQQLNILQTNRDSILMTDQTQRNTLAGEDATNQAYYDSLAVTNAQAVPPNPNLPPIQLPQPAAQTHPNPNGNGTSTGATSTGGTGAPYPGSNGATGGGSPYVAGTRHPSGTQPPSLRGQSNQPNSHSGPTGLGLHIHAPGANGGMKNAATLRAAGGGARVPGTGVTRGGG